MKLPNICVREADKYEIAEQITYIRFLILFDRESINFHWLVNVTIDLNKYLEFDYIHRVCIFMLWICPLYASNLQDKVGLLLRCTVFVYLVFVIKNLTKMLSV